MSISAIILTKNEAKNISRAIESVNFCDEVIVIDDFSEDETVEFAKKSGAKVYEKRLNGDFAKQRNAAMSKAQGDWLLFVDADERISDDLEEEIKKVAIKNKLEYGVYYIKRRDFWWGRELKYGETSSIRHKGLIRLVRPQTGSWKGRAHEVFKTNLPVGSLTNFINHYPHPTLKEFIEDINLYSSLRAKELQIKGERVGLVKIVSYPLGKFIINYFFKLGFLDGPAGFVYAFLMSFHSFLVRAKLYQYTRLSKNS